MLQAACVRPRHQCTSLRNATRAGLALAAALYAQPSLPQLGLALYKAQIYTPGGREGGGTDTGEARARAAIAFALLLLLLDAASTGQQPRTLATHWHSLKPGLIAGPRDQASSCASCAASASACHTRLPGAPSGAVWLLGGAAGAGARVRGRDLRPSPFWVRSPASLRPPARPRLPCCAAGAVGGRVGRPRALRARRHALQPPAPCCVLSRRPTLAPADMAASAAGARTEVPPPFPVRTGVRACQALEALALGLHAQTHVAHTLDGRLRLRLSARGAPAQRRAHAAPTYTLVRRTSVHARTPPARLPLCLDYEAHRHRPRRARRWQAAPPSSAPAPGWRGLRARLPCPARGARLTACGSSATRWARGAGRDAAACAGAAKPARYLHPAAHVRLTNTCVSSPARTAVHLCAWFTADGASCVLRNAVSEHGGT